MSRDATLVWGSVRLLCLMAVVRPSYHLEVWCVTRDVWPYLAVGAVSIIFALAGPIASAATVAAREDVVLVSLGSATFGATGLFR
jgi:hypothetical protein